MQGFGPEKLVIAEKKLWLTKRVDYLQMTKMNLFMVMSMSMMLFMMMMKAISKIFYQLATNLKSKPYYCGQTLYRHCLHQCIICLIYSHINICFCLSVIKVNIILDIESENMDTTFTLMLYNLFSCYPIRHILLDVVDH